MKRKFKCNLISESLKSKTAYLSIVKEEGDDDDLYASLSIPFKDNQFELGKEYNVDIEPA
jgi:hypothetical protein